MAKRNQSLTRRERECRKVVRSKAARKRLQAWLRRAYMGLGAVAAVALVMAGISEYRSSGVSKTIGQAIDGAYGATARAGFAVRTLSLEGRSRTPLSAVKEALAIRPGTPILAVSLEELRARLETLPTVRTADVQRVLPDTLSVHINERQPVALWQSQGRLHLIDDSGAVMDDLALEDFPHLPLLVGSGAPSHVNEVLALLAASPEMKERVMAFMRVGDRRWDIRLEDGPDVKLPQDNAVATWARFTTQPALHGMLSEPLRTIDLRLPGRIVLRPSPVLPDRRDGTNT